MAAAKSAREDAWRVVMERDERQRRVSEWCHAAFGPERSTSVQERGTRLLEEAIEAAQAAGVDRALAHKLVDYVYGRPVGELGQELGGVGVTVLALAQAAGLSAEAEEVREVERVLSKSLDHFRKRHAAKEDAGIAMTPETRIWPSDPPGDINYDPRTDDTPHNEVGGWCEAV